MKTLHLIVCLLAALLPAAAQNTYRGMVTDAETREPLESATVRLVAGSGEALIEYAFTNAKGRFDITSAHPADSLYIMVSMLGYRPLKVKARPGTDMSLDLQTESINLREVVIKPGRIWSRKDTIHYNLADFATSKDETMRDVLKKLPGVDVESNGRISYNGKDISKLYVEGMDLTDGRYNRINNNLQAKAVEAVQVLENHQPVRMLKDKVNTEEVAINLKLKPEFRDKWMTNLQAGAGHAPAATPTPLLWSAHVNALQLSRKSQSIYAYKTNNTGHDISTENMQLASNPGERISQPPLPGFLSQPSLSAPLKKERWLFNNVHTASINRLLKAGANTQLRINAAYTHNTLNQQRATQTTYYQPHDTTTISRQSHTRIRTNKAEASAHLENNGTNRYLTNRLDLSMNDERSHSTFTDTQTPNQQIQTVNAGAKNEFKSLWNKDSHTLEAGSLISYHHLPARLRFDDARHDQRMNLNHFYADNYLALLKKRGYHTLRLTAGFTLQGSNLRNAYTAYLTPYWQRNAAKWRTSLSLPLTYTRFSRTQAAHPAANPALNVAYKYNYAWQFSLSASYKQTYGSITHFYNAPYYLNHQYSIQSNGSLTINRNQYYAAYAEYKNTIREFFATLTLAHQRGWSNRMHEEVVTAGHVTQVTHSRSAHTSGWTANGRISKGFFDYNLKFSLNYIFARHTAQQLSEDRLINITSTYMYYEPKLSWSPHAALHVDYEATLRYGASQIGTHTKLSPLLNMVHKLNLAYSFSSVTLGLSADYYHNDIGNHQTITAFLADASLQWNHGPWQVNLYANNLFNKTQYGYTQYTAVQSYTSQINIRGREFLSTVGYRF